jgi:hypothetical protein
MCEGSCDSLERQKWSKKMEQREQKETIALFDAIVKGPV